MKKLAIIGSGDLGQQIAHHAADSNYEAIGFFDDFRSNSEDGELPILGKIESVLHTFKKGVFDELMIGIGYNHMETRANIFDEFKGQIPFAKIVHSSACIDSSSKIGQGSFIYPGCVVDMNSVIAENISLNVGCVIAHDTVVGSHSMLSPGVILSGFVKVGSSVQLGTGTKVIDNLIISNGVKTGAGATVTKDLIEAGLYVGTPAEYKKPV